MNVLYCGDANISKGIFMSALSLKNHTNTPIHIYILSLRESSEHAGSMVDVSLMEYLQGILQQVNPESTVQVFDIYDRFQACLPAANMDTRFTPGCMLRLYADEIPELPDRLLYLDADVLCRQDPMQLYDMNLENYEIAGVLDNYGKWWFHRHLGHMDYMNSGVLLLNMKAIRSSGLFERCRLRCRNRKMFMPDQSAINKCVSRPFLAERRFNEQKELHPDTVFQHFTTQLKLLPLFHTQSVKPWEIDKVHSILHLHEYDDLFAEYQKRLDTFAKGRDYVR